VPRGQRRRHPLGEGEADAAGRLLVRRHGLVPALGPLALLALVQQAAGERLERQDAHALLCGALHDARAKVPLGPRRPVDGQEHRVEIEALHQRQRGLLRVRGEAEVARLALLARPDKGLHGAARAEDLLHVLRRGHGVQLVEVEMVRAQPLQGLFQFPSGAGGAALARLAGQEHPVPVRRERRPEALLGVPVTRRDVKVVDAALLHRLAHQTARLGGGLVHHQDAAETDDRKHLARVAQSALLHGSSFAPGTRTDKRLRPGTARPTAR